MPFTREQKVEGLLAAGYRIHNDNPDRWAKPIGLQMLTVELDRGEMTLWHMAANNPERICRWDTEPIFVGNHYTDAAMEVLGTEAEIEIKSWRGNRAAPFPFLTADQRAELAIDGGKYAPKKAQEDASEVEAKGS